VAKLAPGGLLGIARVPPIYRSLEELDDELLLLEDEELELDELDDELEFELLPDEPCCLLFSDEDDFCDEEPPWLLEELDPELELELELELEPELFDFSEDDDFCELPLCELEL